MTRRARGRSPDPGKQADKGGCTVRMNPLRVSLAITTTPSDQASFVDAASEGGKLPAALIRRITGSCTDQSHFGSLTRLFDGRARSGRRYGRNGLTASYDASDDAIPRSETRGRSLIFVLRAWHKRRQYWNPARAGHKDDCMAADRLSTGCSSCSARRNL